MQIIHTDVLVIGGGLAGLRTAIAARRRGFDALVLSLVPAKRSHSSAAQGGMQASLGNAVMGDGDNEDVHFADTVRGSDWGADQDVVRMFVNTAPKAVVARASPAQSTAHRSSTVRRERRVRRSPCRPSRPPGSTS